MYCLRYQVSANILIEMFHNLVNNEVTKPIWETSISNIGEINLHSNPKSFESENITQHGRIFDTYF